MKAKHLAVLLTAASALVPFVGPLILEAQPPGPVTRTKRVDCDSGGDLAAALALPAQKLVIEISGTCLGDLRIERDHVTLRGVTPGATVEGDPSIPGPTIFLLGARDVNLEDLTITGDVAGVALRRAAEAQLLRVQITQTAAVGLQIEQASSVVFVDSASTGHGAFGLAVFGESGLTVQGSANLSGNGAFGLLMSDGASLHTQGVGQMVANDNGIAGVSLQAGASGLFPSVEARRNGFAGLDLTFGGDFVSIGANDFSENVGFGVFLGDGSSFFGSGLVRDNGMVGIFATENSHLTIASDVFTEIGGSPIGLALEGASGFFSFIDFVSPVELTFGSRASFGPTVTLGTLTCDGTVLTQGGFSCPPSLRLFESLPGASVRGLLRDELYRRVAERRPAGPVLDF